MAPPTISIHALLAESDHWYHISKNAAMGFLSTLSLRRATHANRYYVGLHLISIHALLAESDLLPQPTPRPQPNFYPRSPCGERHVLPVPRPPQINFYPRSPCGERQNKGAMMVSDVIFLSTLSLRRATSRLPINDSIALFLSTLSLRRATRVS